MMKAFLTGKHPKHQQSGEEAAGTIFDQNQSAHELGGLTIRKGHKVYF